MRHPIQLYQCVASRAQAATVEDQFDNIFHKASEIVPFQDKLSSHEPTSLFETFPAEEARRFVGRFEWHNPIRIKAGWT
jgi:hypothetical protein